MNLILANPVPPGPLVEKLIKQTGAALRVPEWWHVSGGSVGGFQWKNGSCEAYATKYQDQEFCIDREDSIVAQAQKGVDFAVDKMASCLENFTARSGLKGGLYGIPYRWQYGDPPPKWWKLALDRLVERLNDKVSYWLLPAYACTDGLKGTERYVNYLGSEIRCRIGKDKPLDLLYTGWFNDGPMICEPVTDAVTKLTAEIAVKHGVRRCYYWDFKDDSWHKGRPERYGVQKSPERDAQSHRTMRLIHNIFTKAGS